MAGDAEDSETMIRGMYGPDVTFLGVPRAELDSLDGLDVVFLGAPFDGGTSHRPGARFGPQAIRQALITSPHDASTAAARAAAWTRWPNLRRRRCRRCADAVRRDRGHAGPPGEAAVLAVAQRAARFRSSWAATTAIALPDVTTVARHVGWGRVSVIHFDAHADTGDSQFGSLHGHGTPMQRLINPARRGAIASCRSGCAVTGRSRPRWPGWPSSGCARSR